MKEISRRVVITKDRVSRVSKYLNSLKNPTEGGKERFVNRINTTIKEIYVLNFLTPFK
jgi:hypothetical protein